MDGMKTLYLECNTGISGDMIVGALLDLGADEKKLTDVLSAIPAEGFRVEISRVKKAGIDCCDFDVILDEAHDGHDHDMEYLYGFRHDHDPEHHDYDHDHSHDHHHDHDHDHGHDHHHDHDHDHGHHHHHSHRGMAEITEILAGLPMTERARDLAMRTFTILAEAEAKAHGLPMEEVHFHEVGAVDSIADIVAAAVCFDDLDIGEVIVPALTEGHGQVRCQHGILPVPVPAVANIAEACGLPLRITDREGELVTPTGAAFCAAVMTSRKLPENFRIRKTGLGAGKRAYEIPSMVRAMIIEAEAETGTNQDRIWKLECNIDDSTGEQLGYVMNCLFEAGARDVHYLPVFMKKNRPAWELAVVCDEAVRGKLEEIIFRETTTIGIRRVEMERTILPRKNGKVETKYGKIDIKVCQVGDTERFYPEYDSVSGAAKSHGAAFGEVYAAAQAACRDGRVLYGDE